MSTVNIVKTVRTYTFKQTINYKVKINNLFTYKSVQTYTHSHNLNQPCIEYSKLHDYRSSCTSKLEIIKSQILYKTDN